MIRLTIKDHRSWSTPNPVKVVLAKSETSKLLQRGPVSIIDRPIPRTKCGTVNVSPRRDLRAVQSDYQPKMVEGGKAYLVVLVSAYENTN